MWISDTSIKRPVTTITVMAAIVIFGWISFTRLGIDLFPEIDFPYVSVTTILQGASPEVIDNDVTDVLEEQIKTISGVKNIMSQSYEGYSQIVVEFELVIYTRPYEIVAVDGISNEESVILVIICSFIKSYK